MLNPHILDGVDDLPKEKLIEILRIQAAEILRLREQMNYLKYKLVRRER